MGTKIGVLSDTHLHQATEKLKELYEQYLSDKDILIHVGDFVSEEIVDFLSKKPFYGVHGNMDTLDLKRRLPEKRIVDIGPYNVGLIHGSGPRGGLEDRITSEFTDVDVIVYGHSHRPVNHIKDRVLYFNPGTALGYTPSGVNTIGILSFGNRITGDIIDVL